MTSSAGRFARPAGVPYPEEIGGTGLDSLAYAITVEELSRASGSVGIIVSAHTSLGCNPIWMAGTDEQKERFLRPMASGEVIGAYGLTEPSAGSDSRGTRTRARRDGDSWVINGGKRFITNAGVAGTYIVTAVTDREEGAAARSAPSSSRPIRPGSASAAWRRRWASTLEHRRAHLRGLPGAGGEHARRRGEGDKLFLKTLDGGRIGIASMALDWRRPPTRRHRPIRRSGASSIAHRVVPGLRLQDRGHGDRDRCRPAHDVRAAWLKDNGRPYSTEAAMAKLFASEVARDVTNDAVQCTVLRSITEYKVERYLRDAKLTEIGRERARFSAWSSPVTCSALRAM